MTERQGWVEGLVGMVEWKGWAEWWSSKVGLHGRVE